MELFTVPTLKLSIKSGQALGFSRTTQYINEHVSCSSNRRGIFLVVLSPVGAMFKILKCILNIHVKEL